MNAREQVNIIGGGLVGSLWSIFLAKAGYKVELYERRSDPRTKGYVGGRSINLAMSERGWHALKLAGLEEDLRNEALPMYGRMIHSVDGTQTYQPYGREGEAIYSVSRGGLNVALLGLADKLPNVNIHFDSRCEEFNPETGVISMSENGVISKLKDTLSFGTDGAFSALRYGMQKMPLFNYSQQHLEYGYKELSIPPNSSGDYQMNPEALHIWPRGKFMLIALPNTDKSFTCTLFLPFSDGANSFENLNDPEEIKAFLQGYFKDFTELNPNYLEEFIENPTSGLVTVRCFPWHWNHKLLLMGDASHAIVPFFGQGMNAGFEDCTILMDLMDQYNHNWESIIDHFNANRPKDANAIADLALRNFVEMRDLVGDPKFLLRQKIVAHLHEKHGDEFLPMYSMVSFTRTPYHKAWDAGLAQDRLFEKILALEDIETKGVSHPGIDEAYESWRKSEKG
jgi:kynurenine 3-monooxygenase